MDLDQFHVILVLLLAGFSTVSALSEFEIRRNFMKNRFNSYDMAATRNDVRVTPDKGDYNDTNGWSLSQ